MHYLVIGHVVCMRSSLDMDSEARQVDPKEKLTIGDEFLDLSRCEHPADARHGIDASI